MNDGCPVHPADAPAAPEWGSRSQLRTLVLLVATGAGILLCLCLARPFLPALVLGPVVLTVTTVLLEIWRYRAPGSAAPAGGPDGSPAAAEREA